MSKESSTPSYATVTSADEAERQNKLEEDLKSARLTINHLKRQNGILKQKIDEDYRKFEREKTIIQTEKGREITKQKKDNDKLKTELNIQKKEKVKLSEQFQKSLAEWKSRVDSLEETLLQREKDLSRLQLEAQQQKDQNIILYDKQLEQLKEQYRQLQNEIDEANGGEKEKPFHSNGMGPVIVEKQDVLMQCMTTYMERSECFQKETRDAFLQVNAKLDKLQSVTVEETKEKPVGREIQGIERTPPPQKSRTRRDKMPAVKTVKKLFYTTVKS